MAGLFAGHFLRRAGWQVDIFERTAGALSGRGAGIMTHPELLEALRAIGLQTDDDFGVPIATRVTIDRNGDAIASRAFPQIATSWTRVHAMLADSFPRADYHSGVEFEGFEQTAESVTVGFGDGRTVRADMLIGADGFRSSVRRLLFAELTPEYAGYVAWRGMLPETDMECAPFEHTSLFTFNLPAGEHMIGYPVAGPGNDLRPGKRNYNFVWYTPADEIRDLPSLLTDRCGKRHELSIPPTMVAPSVIAGMRAHADRVLAPWFRAAVERTRAPFFQPIYDLAVPRMAVGRVALVGDAAFVVRPHVGVGVLKAADDARTLVQACMAEPDIMQALQAFSAARVPVGEAMIARARYLGSYLRTAYASEGERAAAALVAAPDTVMAETAALDFLRAPHKT